MSSHESLVGRGKIGSSSSQKQIRDIIGIKNETQAQRPSFPFLPPNLTSDLFTHPTTKTFLFLSKQLVLELVGEPNRRRGFVAVHGVGSLLVAGTATSGVVVHPLLGVLGRLRDHIGVVALGHGRARIANVAGAC